MIKNVTRKVYIVNDFKSGNIEQAIFILKSGSDFKIKSSDIAFEAQEIINEYVKKLEKQKSNSNKKISHKNVRFIPIIIIMSVLTLFGFLSYILMFGLSKIL